MGLINNDVYTASNGVQFTGGYISFASETLYLRQASSGSAGSASSSYTLNANYRIYWNQDCREKGLGFVDLKSVSVSCSSSELNNNSYSLLYEELKRVYPNTSNEVKAAPAPAPAPAAPAPSAPAAPAPSDPSAPSAPSAPSDPSPAPSAPSDPSPAPSAPSDPAPAPSAPAPSDPAPAPSAPSDPVL